MPVDYQQGRIYAIRAPGTEDVYIGGTCVPLSRRLAGHRADYGRWKAGKGNFVTSFNLLEREGYYIELVELFPCNSKEELNRREGEVIRATANCVNKYVAGRTDAEYRKDNREELKEYHQQYYESHREERNEKARQYNEAHREELKEYHQQYYESHKGELKEKAQQYRAKKKAQTQVE